MLLRVFEEEHEEQVNHCQFTNTAHRLLLATCSNDKFLNVKVWLLLFWNHVSLIHIAAFLLTLSASFYAISCVKLWNLNKPSSQNTMFGHFEPVNHCCFSPNDAYLSTSSNDGTVKVSNIWPRLCLGSLLVDFETFWTEPLSCLTDLPLHTFNHCVLSSSKWHLPMSGRRSTSGACWRREKKTSLSSAAPGPPTASTSFAEPRMLCWSVFPLRAAECEGGIKPTHNTWTCCEWIGYWSVSVTCVPSCPCAPPGVWCWDFRHVVWNQNQPSEHGAVLSSLSHQQPAGYRLLQLCSRGIIIILSCVLLFFDPACLEGKFNYF